MSRKNASFSKRHLSEDIERQLQAYYERHLGRSDFNLDEVLTRYAFVVTLRADEHRARALKATICQHGIRSEHPTDPRPYNDVRFEFAEFDHLLNVLNMKVYGSKWRSPDRRPQLPFVAVFLDYDGSKLDLGAPKDVRGQHFHALVAFPPSHIDKAREVLPKLHEELALKHPLMHNRPNVEAFDPQRAELVERDKSVARHCLEYLMKGAMKLMAGDRWHGELYRLYPNPNGETYNYPRPPKGSSERKVPYEDDMRIGRRGVMRLRPTLMRVRNKE